MTSEYITIEKPVKLFGFVLWWRRVWVETTNTKMKKLLEVE